MNRDLSVIIKELCTLLETQHKYTKVNKEIDYSPVSDNIIDGLVMYGDTTISDLICLVRIERLFDLKLIDENQKERLIYIYNEYKDLESNLKSIKDNELEYKKYILFRQKFIDLGIIEEFNYEEAFINEIDSKLKMRGK